MEKAARWIWLCSMIYLGLLDVATTYIILKDGGMELSTSPAFLMEKFGTTFTLFVIMPIWKGGIILAIWLVLTRLLTKKWLPALSPKWMVALKCAVYVLIYFYLATQILAVVRNLSEISTPLF